MNHYIVFPFDHLSVIACGLVKFCVALLDTPSSTISKTVKWVSTSHFPHILITKVRWISILIMVINWMWNRYNSSTIYSIRWAGVRGLGSEIFNGTLVSGQSLSMLSTSTTTVSKVCSSKGLFYYLLRESYKPLPKPSIPRGMLWNETPCNMLVYQLIDLESIYFLIFSATARYVEALLQTISVWSDLQLTNKWSVSKKLSAKDHTQALRYNLI